MAIAGLERGDEHITATLIGHLLRGVGMGGSVRKSIVDVFWNLGGPRERGTDIDARDRHGRTALHEEAYQGRAAVVQLLVEKGAGISVWHAMF